MLVNSTKLSFSLPSTKVEEVKNMCLKALIDNEVSMRTMASILGNLNMGYTNYSLCAIAL